MTDEEKAIKIWYQIKSEYPPDDKIKHIAQALTLARKEGYEQGVAESKKAYEPYIKILSEELDEIIAIAVCHGWKTSRYEEGERCREAIRKLTEQKGELI